MKVGLGMLWKPSYHTALLVYATKWPKRWPETLRVVSCLSDGQWEFALARLYLEFLLMVGERFYNSSKLMKSSAKVVEEAMFPESSREMRLYNTYKP